MLVLTRKIGESVIIGDNITITVSHLERGKVRLAIEAPRDIPILRGELAQRTEAVLMLPNYIYEPEGVASAT